MPAKSPPSTDSSAPPPRSSGESTPTEPKSAAPSAPACSPSEWPPKGLVLQLIHERSLYPEQEIQKHLDDILVILRRLDVHDFAYQAGHAMQNLGANDPEMFCSRYFKTTHALGTAVRDVLLISTSLTPFARSQLTTLFVTMGPTENVFRAWELIRLAAAQLLLTLFSLCAPPGDQE